MSRASVGVRVERSGASVWGKGRAVSGNGRGEGRVGYRQEHSPVHCLAQHHGLSIARPTSRAQHRDVGPKMKLSV